MATGDEVDQEWESQAEVDACPGGNRTCRGSGQCAGDERGCFPREIDGAYHGSVVSYPQGTCAQIRAAGLCSEEKNRVDYVGSRLWQQRLSGGREILAAPANSWGGCSTGSPAFS